jgi:hypothetical protein
MEVEVGKLAVWAAPSMFHLGLLEYAANRSTENALHYGKPAAFVLSIAIDLWAAQAKPPVPSTTEQLPNGIGIFKDRDVRK